MKDWHINAFCIVEDAGHVPDLRYCSAFGETPSQAVAELEKGKAAWLEAARDRGQPIPPPTRAAGD